MKKNKKESPPSAYDIMPYYYPAEQVDIVRKLEPKKKKDKTEHLKQLGN